jgi:hypothetical protein
MDAKLQIIKQYFKLSDLASNDEQALHEIIQLFSDESVIKGANGFIADNPTKVTEFFENFFKDNQELRHLCRVSINDDKYQAEWAVAGRKHSGKIFAFHGFDTYEFDQQNKISFLQVEIR